MKNNNWGRVAAGCAVAAALTLLSPFSLAFSTRLFIPAVAIALLHAWAGFAPAALLSAGTLGAAALLGDAYGGYGGAAACVAALTMVAPAWFSIALLRRRPAFFKGLRLSVAAQAAATLAGVVAVWLASRVNLADLLADMLNAFYAGQTPEMMDMMTQLFRQVGLNVTRETMPDLIEAVRLSMLSMLPSVLVCSSVSTGILTYAWPCRVRLRRGDEPPVAMTPLGEWRLPRNMIAGLPACVLVCVALYAMGVNGADSAFRVTLNLAVLAFNVQAVGAISRRMKQSGAPRGRRVLVIVLALLFLYDYLLPLMGVYSALFGSQGLISGFIRKKADENRRGDE